MRMALYRLLILLLTPFSFSAQTQALKADAGTDRGFCDTAYTTLGGNPTAKGGVPPYRYQWLPKTGLNSDTIANPLALITTSTVFTVTVRDNAGTISVDQTVMTLYSYTIDAGPDTTIKHGQTITLNGSAGGATQVYWTPDMYTIYNPATLTPDVFPPGTTTYTLTAVYPGGCTLMDTVTVSVEATDQLFFFNTFTPNGDGANDYFMIGNIEKYPDNVLEIYNRYGQKILTKTNYKNDWDGKYLNQEVPSGTYFYFLDTKSDKGGKYHGQVTVIR